MPRVELIHAFENATCSDCGWEALDEDGVFAALDDPGLECETDVIMDAAREHARGKGHDVELTGGSSYVVQDYPADEPSEVKPHG